MTRQGRGRAVTKVLSVLVAGVAVVGTLGPALPSAAATVTGAGPSVRLAGPTPTLPAGSSVVGPSDASATVTVDVALSPRDPAALDAFVQAVSTPGSPEYHHYLAPGQFAARFGPTAA